MRGHNIYLGGEIRKIIFELSVGIVLEGKSHLATRLNNESTIMYRNVRK